MTDPRRPGPRPGPQTDAQTDAPPDAPADASGGEDRLAAAARRAAERAARGEADPEPSLGARLGQIGALGWMFVAPMLAGLFLGRWIDRSLGTGVLISAPLLMIGAAIGFRSAWKWMNR
ncbi:MAG: ATP synthase protein I [Paracoccaceae bacterium]|jgi:ATP synthase protein I